MVENHPFEPWLPGNAKLLMLGTFPPSEKRWCMPWYYPNFQNDMWRIFGIIYFGDKLHFVDVENKTYRLDAIKEFLKEKGVAIYDTAQQVIRTKNTASDKDLQIVQPSDLDGMLRQLPECRAVLTAGQLATKIFSEHFGIKEKPEMEDSWSLSLKTASFVSIACHRVRGRIRWRWRRRRSSIARCLRTSYKTELSQG